MTTMMDSIKNMRNLDFDDLSIMVLLGEDVRGIDIANYLYLTHPAVSHRLNKFESIFGSDIFKKHQKRRIFTEKGFDIYKRAKNVLYLMMDLPEDFKYQSLFSQVRVKC